MKKLLSGPMITAFIVIGVVAILVLNLQPSSRPSQSPVSSVAKPDQPGQETVSTANAREYPIGEPVVKNHVQVAAVWLAGVTMDGMSSATADVIHLEADVKATDANPNGFAKDEFVPYLKVGYSIIDALSGVVIEKGEMSPMVASDGLHYGASVAMPKPGSYKLVYQIQPPSAGGLGRHVGLGGVAPWWEPFTSEFEWTVEAPASPALAGTR